MKQLKEFQKIGVEFMLNRETALNADDMGLGKTIQSAEIIERLNPKRTLILTLASLKINWQRELQGWVSHNYKYQILYKTTDKVDKEANIIICNYDLIFYEKIKKQLRELNYDVIFLDEAHNLSNMDAKRTKCVYSNSGLIRNSKRVYALTGTPLRNRPKDFYIMLKVLAPECIEPYTHYEDFVVHFCGGYIDRYGALNDRGASNIDELAQRIAPFMIRRLKDDVIKELPPLIEKTIELEITDEIQEVLNNESDLEADLNEFNPNSELGVQATIRRLLGIAKLPQVYEYVENLLQQEDKIGIFAYHKDVINELRLHFRGYGVRAIQGGMSAKAKQMEVDLFIKDPNSRIFVGQFTAAGFGIDGLQKVCNNVVFAEMDWVPGNMDQARDRYRRIGQTCPVIAHYLITPNTLEDNMLQTVIKKGEVITRILSNTVKQKKEEITMTIENSLERIANLLERIANAAEAKRNCTCESNAEEPKKKAAPKKKTEAKKEDLATEAMAIENAAAAAAAEVIAPQQTQIQADPLGLGVPTVPAVQEVKYTADDVRTAFTQFVSKYPADKRQEAVNAAKAILAKYNYNLVTDVQEKDYANVIADLKAVA